MSIRPSALLTDLYQLTMLDAYYQLGMEQSAVFEFVVRRLPAARNFIPAAGTMADYASRLPSRPLPDPRIDTQAPD